MVEREPTGITGLDELIEGGFPKNSVILVSGSPGTGKSIFAQQFLYTGANEFKEKGLYISFEQRIPEIFEQAARFGWNFPSLERQDLLKFFFIDMTQRKLDPEQTHIDLIKSIIREHRPKRIVIDSITPLANIPVPIEELANYGIISELSSFMPNISQELITRFQVHRLIMTLKDFKATSVITSQIPKDSKWLSSDKASEFLSDGLILLNFNTGSEFTRTLTIEKMRNTKHCEETLAMQITNKGIVVKKPEELL